MYIIYEQSENECMYNAIHTIYIYTMYVRQIIYDDMMYTHVRSVYIYCE